MAAGNPAGGITECAIGVVEVVDDDMRIELRTALIEGHESRSLNPSVVRGCRFAKSRVFAELDEGIGQRVIEGAVAGLAGQRFEKRGGRGRIADAAECFGGGTLVLR